MWAEQASFPLPDSPVSLLSSSTWRSEWGGLGTQAMFLPYFSLLGCEVEILPTFPHHGNVEWPLTIIFSSSYNYLVVFLPSFYKCMRKWRQQGLTDHFGILYEKRRKRAWGAESGNFFFLEGETCLYKQREFVYRLVVLKLECVSESPGGLVKPQIAGCTYSFWFSRSGVEQENLHF